ncbi:MAG: hypothetical protein PHE68_02070 [Candidatus Peribacteraceae bacterium]|nr:hypothetical protein [Candidatus Peribacteraceae bacterium]MDD5074450.1 hypothetical protein [Candidatus Peribacteraceae bacterium]
MSTAILEHPPHGRSASDVADRSPSEARTEPAVSSGKTLDRLVTAEVAGDVSFIQRRMADLIQCCIRRAAIDRTNECVRWEEEIPSEITDALTLSPDACNTFSMTKALMAIEDLEQRRVILRTIIQAIIQLQ